MGVRGRTEVRNIKRLWSAYCFSSSKLRSAGCRGVRASARWVPFAAGVCKAAAGYRVWGGRACFRAAGGTIQEAVADGPALHSRVHFVLRGLEFWFR